MRKLDSPNIPQELIISRFPILSSSAEHFSSFFLDKRFFGILKVACYQTFINALCDKPVIILEYKHVKKYCVAYVNLI